jgi:signal recognition particle subunit SRP68
LSGSSSSSAGTRDIHFIHAYIVYQLLSRRIQRDLLLVSALVSSHDPSKTQRGSVAQKVNPLKEHVDSRLFPAVVKLLDTVLQSLNQMRILSIVDEGPDLASAVEVRLSFTKARRSAVLLNMFRILSLMDLCFRCLYLARCYAPVKKYAEGLTLLQHANIHLRGTRSTLSLSDYDPITFGSPVYYPLSSTDIAALEGDLSADALTLKKDWLVYNGGSIDLDHKTYKKPLFFDIALNYVQLDMDQLQERAGKKPKAPANAHLSGEKKKAKVEDEVSTPEPQVSAPVRSGLSSLLGGWWGRK